MTNDRTNENEGVDPSSDVEKQNRGTGSTGEDRAGTGEGYGTDQSDTKAQDLAKAGRDDFDPNDGQE